MSRSRSRSPRATQTNNARKPLEEAALESLVSKKLAKWLSPDSEEIKLLAQFCATMAHADDNWQQEIREEVLPFLHEDTPEFIEWITKSRWKDQADNKFGKAALRLRERALQEASGTLPPPDFKPKGPKEVKRPQKGAGKPTTPKANLPNPQVDCPAFSSKEDDIMYATSLRACSSYAMPVNPVNKCSNNNADTYSMPPRGRKPNINVAPARAPPVPTPMPVMEEEHIPAVYKTPLVEKTTLIVPPNGTSALPDVTFGQYDYTKDEYQNLTLGHEPAKDKSGDRRKIQTNRLSIQERQTKVLQDLLTKLNDPNCDEKQREKLGHLVGKLKEQMQMIKVADPPKTG